MADTTQSHRWRRWKARLLVLVYYCAFFVLTGLLWLMAQPAWQSGDSSSSEADNTAAVAGASGFSVAHFEGLLSKSGQTVRLNGKSLSYPPGALMQITEPLLRIEDDESLWTGRADNLQMLHENGLLLMTGDVRLSGRFVMEQDANTEQTPRVMLVRSEQLELDIPAMQLRSDGSCYSMLDERYQLTANRCHANLKESKLTMQGDVRSSF